MILGKQRINFINPIMKLILTVVFSDILDTGQVEDQKKMKEKLIEGKELQVGLEANQPG